VPTELWLVGHDSLAGRYELITDQVEGGRPVYRLCSKNGSQPEAFLWFRGGNWGITNSLKASPMAAPFLARCADLSGRARHPLELRRPRWQVRRGRGQEEPDAALQLLASEPLDDKGAVAAVEKSAIPDESLAAAGTPPAAVLVTGRVGIHAEANGRYELTGATWRGKPVYAQRTSEEVDALSLFFEQGYWVIAPDVCSLPRTVARHQSQADSSHPACSSGAAGRPWEFLEDESKRGHMVNMNTRTYAPDRKVVLRIAEASEGSHASDAAPSAPVSSSRDEAGTPFAAFDPPNRGSPKSGCPEQRRFPSEGFPRWVAEASAEIHGDEVRVLVTCNPGVAVNLASLDLSVGSHSLKVCLEGQESALELQLPAAVDSDLNPVARWSEKTRTLRVRLSLLQ